MVHLQQYYLLWLVGALKSIRSKAFTLSSTWDSLVRDAGDLTWVLMHAKGVLYYWDTFRQDIYMLCSGRAYRVSAQWGRTSFAHQRCYLQSSISSYMLRGFQAGNKKQQHWFSQISGLTLHIKQLHAIPLITPHNLSNIPISSGLLQSSPLELFLNTLQAAGGITHITNPLALNLKWKPGLPSLQNVPLLRGKANQEAFLGFCLRPGVLKAWAWLEHAVIIREGGGMQSFGLEGTRPTKFPWRHKPTSQAVTPAN